MELSELLRKEILDSASLVKTHGSRDKLTKGLWCMCFWCLTGQESEQQKTIRKSLYSLETVESAEVTSISCRWWSEVNPFFSTKQPTTHSSYLSHLDDLIWLSSKLCLVNSQGTCFCSFTSFHECTSPLKYPGERAGKIAHWVKAPGTIRFSTSVILWVWPFSLFLTNINHKQWQWLNDPRKYTYCKHLTVS